MAQFSGTGSLTLNGPDSRFYDFECANSGGLIMDGDAQIVDHCRFATPITVASGSTRCAITNNYFNLQGVAITLTTFTEMTIIAHNRFDTGED